MLLWLVSVLPTCFLASWRCRCNLVPKRRRELSISLKQGSCQAAIYPPESIHGLPPPSQSTAINSPCGKKMERLCEASSPIGAHELQLNRLALARHIIQ